MRVCETCHTPYRSSIDFCGLDGSRLSDKQGDPLKGVVIDRYRLIERLGGGGMAAVYKAQHETIDRVVAIKLLYGELASNKEFAERFRREAQASSKIKHKNVVEVVDFGTTEHGASFLIMELLRGHTLGAALSAAGTFTPARAARVVRDVAAGLAAAHDLGFVHRDLKPGNIMLLNDGDETAKIVDFGLVGAEPLSSSASSTSHDEQKRLTQSGVTMGTPHYMAPEQIAGMGCTGQSDLYSLGVVLHELLTGAAPFHGSLGEILVQHAHQAPPPLPPARGLEKIAAKLLEKEPRRRPRDAHELLALIDKTGLVPSSSSSSSSRSSSTADLLSALGPAAMTETALRAPPRTAFELAASAATVPVRPQRSWRGAAVVVVIIAVAAVAAVVVANGSSAGANVDAAPVKATQDKVAAAALDAARALVVRDSVVDAGAAVIDDKAAARAKADVDAALAARGFDRHDAANIAAVATAVAAFDNDGKNAAAVVTAIAGARVDAALVRKKIDRVAQLSTSKRQKKQVEQLVKELGKRSSEAERGQLMLKLQRLAAELERAPRAPGDDKHSEDKKGAPGKKRAP